MLNVCFILIKLSFKYILSDRLSVSISKSKINNKILARLDLEFILSQEIRPYITAALTFEILQITVTEDQIQPYKPILYFPPLNHLLPYLMLLFGPRKNGSFLMK